MSTEKELLMAFLSKSLNLDSQGVTSLIYNEDGTELKADAIDSLLSKQAAVISAARINGSTGKLSEGKKAGYKEAAEKFEADIKEAFGITSDAIGADLINEVKTKVASSTEGNVKVLTDDDVKKHKVYLDLHAKLLAAEKAADERVNTEVGKVKSEWKRNETINEVLNAAIVFHKSRKPVLSKNEQIAMNQLKALKDEINQYNWEIQGEGNNKRIVALDKDGKILEDNLGHPVQFESLITTIGDRYYDFEASDSRSSGGNPNDKGASSGGASSGTSGVTLRKPTSTEDWMKQHEDIESNKLLKPDEKIKLQSELKNLFKGESKPV